MRRASGVGIAAIVLLLGLTACDPITDPDAPVAVSVRSDSLQLAACESVVVDRLTLEVRSAGFGSAWRPLVSWEGRFPLGLGEIDLNSVPDGVEGDPLGSAQVLPGDTISIYLRVLTPVDRPNILAEVVIPESSGSSWIRPDGTMSDRACD